MKISKTVKTALLAVIVAVGSLGAMSFTPLKTGICVKQTVTFNSGKVITLYYVQDGNSYALYSTARLNNFKLSDLKRIKDNHFEVCKGYDGKCYYQAKSLNEVLSMANALFQQHKPQK